MKIIITENKLDLLIYNFIDNYYGEEIHENPYHDEDGNPSNVATEYYLGDYDGDFEEELFTLYQKDYWIGDTPHSKLKQDDSPILVIQDDNFVDTLTSMFGNKWKPIFKQWFFISFGEKYKTLSH